MDEKYLNFMEQLQMVLIYSKTFEEEYGVAFLASIFRDILDEMKALH